MNLSSAATLVSELENLFGQTFGWEMPETILKPARVSLSEFWIEERQIHMGVFKCTPEKFSFIWLHEAYHFVQFALEGRDADKYRAVFARAEKNGGDEYYWVKEEREANVFAYETCMKLGLTDFIPEHIPAGYFD